MGGLPDLFNHFGPPAQKLPLVQKTPPPPQPLNIPPPASHPNSFDQGLRAPVADLRPLGCPEAKLHLSPPNRATRATRRGSSQVIRLDVFQTAREVETCGDRYSKRSCLLCRACCRGRPCVVPKEKSDEQKKRNSNPPIGSSRTNATKEND